MKRFIDDNFLLETETARALFHDVAKGLPIIDYHCHLSPAEIWNNAPFGTITRVWLGGDHYKWRLMRCAGVDESFITGDAPEREKFQKWAETLALAAGNPLYHWSHLELSRYFGYRGTLNGATAQEVWDKCNDLLAGADFTPRAMIERSNVEVVCTTDDPVDNLNYHKKLAAEQSFKTKVLPAWRPDKALNIEKNGYIDYIQKLSLASGVAVYDLPSLKNALKTRMEFFHSLGCRLSDHALNYVSCVPTTDAEADAIMRRKLRGDDVSPEDTAKYKYACLRFMGSEYARLDWAMQIHFGCKRDNSPEQYRKLGPDTGFDCIYNNAPSAQLADFLASFGKDLPRTILYSLNPNDDEMIQSVVNCFQSGAGITKVQQGSAWWFNDHIDGMEKQLKSLANTGFLAGFIGMLTDSRSFLSYPRHEYFRRILCNLLGNWVDKGLFPNDAQALTTIVKNVSYENAKKYFGF